MFRSGRYSDINVPVNFPVRTKFMPYPHKNSDGVIPKKVEPDIWGGKPAPGEAQPGSSDPACTPGVTEPSRSLQTITDAVELSEGATSSSCVSRSPDRSSAFVGGRSSGTLNTLILAW